MDLAKIDAPLLLQTVRRLEGRGAAVRELGTVKADPAPIDPPPAPTVYVEPAPVVVQPPPTFRWRAIPHRDAQGLIDYIDIEPVQIVEVA